MNPLSSSSLTKRRSTKSSGLAALALGSVSANGDRPALKLCSGFELGFAHESVFRDDVAGCNHRRVGSFEGGADDRRPGYLTDRRLTRDQGHGGNSPASEINDLHVEAVSAKDPRFFGHPRRQTVCAERVVANGQLGELSIGNARACQQGNS